MKTLISGIKKILLIATVFICVSAPSSLGGVDSGNYSLSLISVIQRPVGPVIFQQIRANVEFKAMFPGGQTIIPTYELGIPAGADKSLMEP